jgi:hypothetical protein
LAGWPLSTHDVEIDSSADPRDAGVAVDLPDRPAITAGPPKELSFPHRPLEYFTDRVTLLEVVSQIEHGVLAPGGFHDRQE